MHIFASFIVVQSCLYRFCSKLPFCLCESIVNKMRVYMNFSFHAVIAVRQK